LGHKFDITGNQLTVEMSAVSFEVVYWYVFNPIL
jgi:hypothetical protein